MGQKVNPHGLRVGVIKDWSTRWYAKDKDFADLLIELENLLRKHSFKQVYLKLKLKDTQIELKFTSTQLNQV